MTLAGLLVFAAAYALAVASPGPGIAAVVGQVLGRGIRAAPALVAGILIGDLIWFTCAALGLAALAQAYAGIFLAIKWVGVAYLAFLAWKMWTSPVDALQASADRKDISHVQLFISGLSLTLGNPKAIAFFMALLPAIVDLAAVKRGGLRRGGAPHRHHPAHRSAGLCVLRPRGARRVPQPAGLEGTKPRVRHRDRRRCSRHCRPQLIRPPGRSRRESWAGRPACRRRPWRHCRSPSSADHRHCSRS